MQRTLPDLWAHPSPCNLATPNTSCHVSHAETALDLSPPANRNSGTKDWAAGHGGRKISTATSCQLLLYFILHIYLHHLFTHPTTTLTIFYYIHPLHNTPSYYLFSPSLQTLYYHIPIHHFQNAPFLTIFFLIQPTLLLSSPTIFHKSLTQHFFLLHLFSPSPFYSSKSSSRHLHHLSNPFLPQHHLHHHFPTPQISNPIISNPSIPSIRNLTLHPTTHSSSSPFN
jgi:hypothetical protein